MSLIFPQSVAFEQKQWPVLFKGPGFPSLDRSAAQIVELPDEVNHQKGIVKQEVFFADLGDKCKVIRKLDAKSDPQYPKTSDNAKFLNYPITFSHSLSYDIDSRHKRIQKLVIIGSAQDGVGFDHSRFVSYEVEMQRVPAMFDDQFVQAPRAALAALDIEKIKTQLTSANVKDRLMAMESMSSVQLEPNNEISSILVSNPDRDHWQHENYFKIVESCVMPHDVERFVARALQDGTGPSSDRYVHVLALLERGGEKDILLTPEKLENVFATLLRSGKSDVARETIRVLQTRFPGFAEEVILKYVFNPKQIKPLTGPALQTLAVVGSEKSLRAMEDLEANFDSAKLPWSRTRGSNETRKLKTETLAQLIQCIKSARERLLTVK